MLWSRRDILCLGSNTASVYGDSIALSCETDVGLQSYLVSTEQEGLVHRPGAGGGVLTL